MMGESKGESYVKQGMEALHRKCVYVRIISRNDQMPLMGVILVCEASVSAVRFVSTR
jgi:hypothetical protein